LNPGVVDQPGQPIETPSLNSKPKTFNNTGLKPYNIPRVLFQNFQAIQKQGRLRAWLKR
jgi:hypothetical protein